MLLGHVGYLIGAHAVVRQDHEQRAGDECEREHAGLLHAHQLRDHDGEDGEHHAPCAHAHRIPHVVARGAVRGVLFLLVGKRALGYRAQQAVAPAVDAFRDEVGLTPLAGCLALTRRSAEERRRVRWRGRFIDHGVVVQGLRRLFCVRTVFGVVARNAIHDVASGSFAASHAHSLSRSIISSHVGATPRFIPAANGSAPLSESMARSRVRKMQAMTISGGVFRLWR